MKRLTAWLCLWMTLLAVISPVSISAESNRLEGTKEKSTTETTMEISAEAAVLMEASTGEILFEKNKDQQRMPASITKIMTLLLIFDALADGKITLQDSVSVSEHAASMGGSQVFLEPNETQTVDTMIKCISIASANDASVAMAEYIAGSEEEFVAQMNERAKKLGMENTHFLNCCGLDDDITQGHYSSAYDIALMSRELITKYPEISSYSTVWMDTIIHSTKKGDTEFGLTNTNKLIRTYHGITGLKTGSTSKAKYCLSATANRNEMSMIAVVLACPSPKDRFSEAAKLLDYGFASCSLYKDANKDTLLPQVKVKKGVLDTVEGEILDEFSYLCLKGVKKESIQKEIKIETELTAPVTKGMQIGQVVYSIDGKEIGYVPILAKEEVAKAKYWDYLIQMWKKYFLIEEKKQEITDPINQQNQKTEEKID